MQNLWTFLKSFLHFCKENRNILSSKYKIFVQVITTCTIVMQNGGSKKEA